MKHRDLGRALRVQTRRVAHGDAALRGCGDINIGQGDGRLDDQAAVFGGLDDRSGDGAGGGDENIRVRYLKRRKDEKYDHGKGAECAPRSDGGLKEKWRSHPPFISWKQLG